MNVNSIKRVNVFFVNPMKIAGNHLKLGAEYTDIQLTQMDNAGNADKMRNPKIN